VLRPYFLNVALELGCACRDVGIAKRGILVGHRLRVFQRRSRNDGQIYMLLIYPRAKKDDMTDHETALLREFVKAL
jgi:hypothetical protein